MFTSPLWDVWSAVCWHCTCTWITQWRPENCFQTHVQVGSGEIGPLQVRAAQVGVRQVAAAQIGHLEIDVTQIQSGQISAAEIKTLKSQRVRELKFNLMWFEWWRWLKHCDSAVPDSAARISWVSPGENGQTLCGRWESGPPEAASSVQRVRTWSWCCQGSDHITEGGSHLILIGSIKTACQQTLEWTEQPDWDRFKRSLLVCNQRFVRLRKWSYNRSVAYRLWIYVKSCHGNMFARQTGRFPWLIGQKLFKLLCCIPLCSLCQFIKCSK